MTANAARSKVRSAVETVFAAQKHRFGLFVRTIGLARATMKIGLANLTYNMRRLVWIEQPNPPARALPTAHYHKPYSPARLATSVASSLPSAYELGSSRWSYRVRV